MKKGSRKSKKTLDDEKPPLSDSVDESGGYGPRASSPIQCTLCVSACEQQVHVCEHMSKCVSVKLMCACVVSYICGYNCSTTLIGILGFLDIKQVSLMLELARGIVYCNFKCPACESLILLRVILVFALAHLNLRTHTYH